MEPLGPNEVAVEAPWALVGTCSPVPVFSGKGGRGGACGFLDLGLVPLGLVRVLGGRGGALVSWMGLVPLGLVRVLGGRGGASIFNLPVVSADRWPWRRRSDPGVEPYISDGVEPVFFDTGRGATVKALRRPRNLRLKCS